MKEKGLNMPEQPSRKPASVVEAALATSAIPYLHPLRQQLIDVYAPTVAMALEAAGMDMPLSVVKARLADPGAQLSMPSMEEMPAILRGDAAATSVETVKTTEKVVTSARDLLAARPLSVTVQLKEIPAVMKAAVTG